LIKKSISGGMSLWHESTEKFSGGVASNYAAVVGAVVSKPAEMKAFAEKTFGRYGGIAQQYLFYYMREK
jgi:hypothetical protein